jgi:hypothetical protein
MTREQIQSHFEDLHRRIEHAIIEYEDATGQEVGILRSLARVRKFRS